MTTRPIATKFAARKAQKAADQLAEQEAMRLMGQHIDALHASFTNRPDMTVTVNEPREGKGKRPAHWGPGARYQLTAYRLTGAHGGFLIETYRQSGRNIRGTANRPSVTWAGLFDTYRLRIQRLQDATDYARLLASAVERIRVRRHELVEAMVRDAEVRAEVRAEGGR